jgi:hypothetical protein
MTLNELIRSGVLPIGTELIWKRAIRTSDGKLHKSPSGAARHLNNGKPVDGWKVWRIKESGILIDTLRIKDLESSGN